MIYLDNSATTRPFDSVAEIMGRSAVEDFYNISSPYAAALKTEKKYDEARTVLAKSLNANKDEIIFTSGGTESDNTALNLAPDNSEVIVSAIEHHAVLNCEAFLKKRGISVVLCPVNEKGIVEAETLVSLITERTSVVSIMHVNNELGAVNDIAALVAAVKQKNKSILFHSDGVQAFMHVATDVKKLGVDLYSVSAHKVHGPKGIGLLYVKKGVKFTPFIEGGGQQDNRRSGTVNVPAAVAFAEAVKATGSFEEYCSRLLSVKEEYKRLLLQIPDTVFFEGDAPNILSVSFMGVKASSLQTALEGDVIVGKGSACTSRSSKLSHVLEAIRMPMNRAEATVRLSFGAFNTVEEAEKACEKIAQAVAYLRKYKRK